MKPKEFSPKSEGGHDTEDPRGEGSERGRKGVTKGVARQKNSNE